MGQDRKLDVEQMTELLEEHDFKKLKEELETIHPVDIVDAMEELDKKQRTLIFRLLAKEEAAEVFTDMDSDMREESDQCSDRFRAGRSHGRDVCGRYGGRAGGNAGKRGRPSPHGNG